MSRPHRPSTLALAFCTLIILDASHGKADKSVNETPIVGQHEIPTHDESSWNSTHENPLITAVTLKTVNNLHLRGFKPETVFQHGKLVGKWANCGSNGVQFTNCIVFPSYADRVSLTYSYDWERIAEYYFAEPVVIALTHGANPAVDIFDHSDRSFSFTVYFNCAKKESGNSTEVLDLHIPILRNFTIITRFTKKCTSGVHPYVRLGVKKGREEEYIKPDTSVIDVAPTVQTSDLFIRVVEPAASIIHDVPTLHSSNRDVEVKLRGITDHADILVGTDLKFWVMYECMTNDETNVSVTVPIPPWDDLTVKLRKKCRGMSPAMLDIGTSAGSSDVLDKGDTMGPFNVTNAVGYTKGADSYVVSRNKSRLSLHIRNTNRPGQAAMHLGKLHVTISQRDTVRVVLEQSQGAELGSVGAGESRVEEVRFVCLKEGSAKIMFSLPVLQYRIVEFCVTKECEAPRAIKEFGWQGVWTVGGAEDLLFVAVALGLIACCVRSGGKREMLGRIVRGRGYERVSVG